jgi:multiple sugar transport system permease protein
MSRRLLSRHVIPGLLALLFLLPLLYLVLGSLRARGLAPPRGLELIPEGAGLGAYRSLYDLLPVTTYLRNSVIVVAVAVPVTVLVASLAGFGIRMLRPRTRRWAIGATLVVMMVPVTAVWATRFELFRLAGIIDTLVPLVAPALLATNPFLVLVYVWAFSRIADEHFEAAVLEGSGGLRMWWSVGMPQVRTATLAVVVLAFTFHWSNFIDPLLYLNSQGNFTLPIGLDVLRLLNPTDWPLLLAGGVVVALPVVAVLLVGQRFFLSDEGIDRLLGRS